MYDPEIVRIILEHYPTAQAIYLFGTYSTEFERPDSDVDIAILLPHSDAKREGFMTFSDAVVALERLLGKDVDLINLRQVSTVFQKEIIMVERRIFCANTYAADEFEMLTLSFYQKLNEERADVLAEGLRSGRFYNI
ncbi:MAG: nucleotidyltransferase domain-containing protein [Candidatus Latescibacter sp.]|nr:nucleotidyltransferase domain-containing protein [Candidatus Latescibacter sp.]